jgi:hypothetical protein
MLELYHHAFSPVNLPFTVPLLVCLIYWLLMIAGLFDLDSFNPDFDVSHDVHVDGHLDAHVDGHADVDHHADAHASGGIFHAIFDFLNVMDVPMMIVMSVLTFCGWAFSITANYYFNPDLTWMRALLLMIPNFLLSVILTHFMTLPLKKLFKSLSKDMNVKVALVGKVATVDTGEVSSTFGQATVDIDGVPITINVRSSAKNDFTRGDKVLVVEEDKKERLFKVVKYEEPKLKG